MQPGARLYTGSIMGHLRRMAVVFGTAGMLCLTAQADILHMDSNVHAGANSNSMVYNATSYADLASPHALPNDFVSGIGSSAQVDLEYDFAQLHARASATRSAGGNGANGAGQLTVTDLCTISSSTLPVGTPVTLTFNLAVHANFIHPANWTENGFDDVLFSLGDVFSNSVSGEMRNSGTQTISFTTATAVGAQTFLNYHLLVTASAPGDPGGTTTVDAFNTADLYVTSNTNGVDVTSGGSLIYPGQPVPEPCTWLGLGLGGVVLVRRRSRA